MFGKAVEVDTYTLTFVPDPLKTEEMCEKAVEKKPWSLKFVPDRHKTQGMCNEVVQKGSYLRSKNWFKRAHVGKFLGLPQIEKSLVGLDKGEIRARNDFDPTHTTTAGWSGPKDQQNKTDKFLSVFGVMYTIVNSKKDKSNVLKKHILKDIIRCGFDTKIEEIQEKNRQGIEGKDAAIGLLKDGPKKSRI